jgi:hypothetical protein
VTCRQDTFDYYMPGIAEIKRTLLAGQFPTWAPYEVGGAPLGGLPNHGALSPMSLPYFVLPLWLAPAYIKLLEFTVAIGGMVLFLRRLGLSRLSGLVAGVVFAASGFMVMWTNWPHTRVAALIPAIFWALERLIQELRARDVVLVGAVLASMLLGGFPAVVLFSHTAAAAYVVVRVLMLHRSRPGVALRALLASAGGVALGIGLSAVQIVPFAANIQAFDFASRDETGHHLPLYTAFTVIDPYAVGTCVGGERYGSANPVEAIGFLGGAAVVLATAALVLRRRASDEVVPIPFFAISAAALGIAIWAGGPVLAALELIPLWSTNFVGRAQSVFGFLAAVLVGVGFDRLYRGETDAAAGPAGRRVPGNRQALRVGLVAVGSAIVAVLVSRAMVRVARAGEFTDHLLSTVTVPLIVLFAGSVAVAVAARASRGTKTLALAVLAVSIMAPSAAFANTLLPVSRVKDFYPVTPTHTYLAEHLGHDRYGAQGAVMFPATTDFYELRTPVGHEFTDQRWKDVLRAADPEVQRSITFSTFSPSLPIEKVQESPALDQLSVRYWVASPSSVVGSREPMPDGGRGSVAIEEGTTASCKVPGGALRGIRVHVEKTMPRTPDGRRPMLHVSVTSGGVQREGSILIDTKLDPGRLFVAVAGEDLPNGSTADVSFWLTDVDGTRVFRGQGDQLDCAAVRPAADGMRLVHSDAGGAVYQRLESRPRIRWASTTRVVTDGDERVALVAEGLPSDTVLLEDDGLPSGQGLSADLDIHADEREIMSVHLEAEGAGYVVVADSIVRPGWHATVDGSPVAIAYGNHAFAAIPVPAGDHVVEIRYVAPGLRAGVAGTVVSLLLATILVLGPTLAQVRRRRIDQRSASELP